MGYNKNTAVAIRHGTPYYGGIRIRCLYMEQGISAVHQFIRHWRSDSNISKLLRITVSWCQLSLGTGISMFDDQRDLLHFESKWLRFIRNFLRHINGRFELDNAYVVPIQREGDVHLMDIIIDSKQFSKNQINQLNYCRMFLSVYTLSDITKSNGLWLHQEFVDGKPINSSHECDLISVRQQKPSPQIWKLWKKANKIWSTKGGKL